MQPLDIRFNNIVFSIDYFRQIYSDTQISVVEGISLENKTGVIENILARVPLPSMYFIRDKDDKLITVSEGTVLAIIIDFLNDGFSLTGTKLFPTVEKQFFSELDRRYQRRLQEASIQCYVVDKRSDDVVADNVDRLQYYAV